MFENKDKNYKQLCYTAYYEYEEDGSEIGKFVFEEQQWGCCYSYVCTYDKNKKPIKSRYYKDKNFERLYLTEFCEYKEDGSKIEKRIYEEPKSEIYYSKTENFNENDKPIRVECYKDKGFKNRQREYCRSSVCNRDKNGRIIKIECYEDKKFKELYMTLLYEYQQNGDTIKKYIFEREN